MPLVSIVIPTYNRARLVGDAIRSALGQSYPYREVIVSDDGSTDGTPGIVRAFGDAVRYDWQPNAGVEAARNRGASLARGDYLYFLDSDDTIRPHAVDRLVALLDAHPEAGIAYGKAEEHDATGTVTRMFEPPYARPAGVWSGADELAHLLLGNYMPTGSLMLRRVVFDGTGGFRSEFHGMAEDWDVWVRTVGHSAAGFVPEVVQTVRYQPGGLTTRMDANHVHMYLRNWQCILDAGLETPNGRSMTIAHRTRAQAFFLYKTAHLAYATHDTVTAREHLSRAVMLWPRLLLDRETREVRHLWLKLRVPEALMEIARANKR